MLLKKYNRQVIQLLLLVAACLCSTIAWAQSSEAQSSEAQSSEAQSSETQSARAITVDELFRLGIENSRRIQASKINEDIAREMEAVSRSRQLPDLNVGLLGGYVGTPTRFERGLTNGRRVEIPNWSQNYSLEASQTIFQGGKIARSIERAAIERQIAALNTDLDQAEVKLLLMDSYLNLIKLYKQQEVFAHNIEEAKVRLHDIRQMRKEGMITQNDVIRSELQLTNYELSLRETQNDIAILSLQLDVALGLDEELLLQPDTMLLSGVHHMCSYQEYVAQAYTNYPEIKIARSDIELARIDTRMARADYMPMLSVRAANVLGRPITTSSPVQDVFKNSWNVSLVLSYNISSLYHNKHNVSAKLNAVRWQQTREEQVMQQVRTEVKAAYIKHQESLDRIGALAKYVQQAEENYRIVQNKYLNQLAILTDLLDASNVRLDAQLQLTEAKANEVYTYYKLLRTSGNL